MPDWRIVIPVWGEKHCELFLERGVPSLRAALNGHRVHFLIRTDAPEAIADALAGYEVHYRPIGPDPNYKSFCAAHREGLAEASLGQHVVSLNADHVVSGNFFDGLARHFAAGAKCVILSGFRTDIDAAHEMPIGAAPRNLLAWGLEHQHKITRDLFWGEGGSRMPSTLFFRRNGTVIHRGFHLHPAAVLKEGPIKLGGHGTIDWGLLDNYAREHVHVVTDADDIAMLEISPHDRDYGTTPEPMTVERVAAWAKRNTTEGHRWLFTHRMVMQGGNEDVGDIAVCGDILARLL